MTIKDTSRTEQQAEELERALEAQYRADRQRRVPAAEREGWQRIRRAAAEKLFRGERIRGS